MTIVLTAGGSGGHITPILAVASELKKLKPDVRLVYVGQKGDKLVDIPAQHPAIDAVYTVSAGKFRRYNGEGVRQLLDIRTQALNVRDAFRVVAGIIQSYFLMRRLRPQIIFSRGGFVSVPVCLGGKLNGVPYITHDSDALPSLANRIIARWAMLHAVALPEELYPYPRRKTKMVGVPVSADYVHITTKLQHSYKQETGLEKFKQVLLVTGGGNGADQLNKAVARNVPALLERYRDMAVVHVAGRGLEPAVSELYDSLLSSAERKQVFVKGFVSDLYRYSGAADVIIARGGATNLAEFAIQRKACIIVPATQLVGGHQIKNAEAMHKRGAILMLNEAESEEDGKLASLVSGLMDNESRRRQLGDMLAAFARPDAARQLAMLLLEKIPAVK